MRTIGECWPMETFCLERKNLSGRRRRRRCRCAGTW